MGRPTKKRPGSEGGPDPTKLPAEPGVKLVERGGGPREQQRAGPQVFGGAFTVVTEVAPNLQNPRDMVCSKRDKT